ncbi:MAG TPA: hypothetical protein VIG07_14565 [Methylomirabilota bacterium]
MAAARTQPWCPLRGEDSANRLSDGVFRQTIKWDGRSSDEVIERVMGVREFGRWREFETARAAVGGRV